MTALSNFFGNGSSAAGDGRLWKSVMITGTGSSTFIPKTGIYEYTVTLVGGGGSGGIIPSYAYTGVFNQQKESYLDRIKSGGGGQVCIMDLTVQSSDSISVAIGAGGARKYAPASFSNSLLSNDAGEGNYGSDSILYLNGVETIRALGGWRGTYGSNGNGAGDRAKLLPRIVSKYYPTTIQFNANPTTSGSPSTSTNWWTFLLTSLGFCHAPENQSDGIEFGGASWGPPNYVRKPVGESSGSEFGYPRNGQDGKFGVGGTGCIVLSNLCNGFYSGKGGDGLCIISWLE